MGIPRAARRREAELAGDGEVPALAAVGADLGGEPELLTWAVLMRRRRRAEGERLVPRAVGDHAYADTRAIMVVVTGIARLPPQIDPCFRVLIAPEQYRLA
jgi:hypothetical protein